MIICIENAYSRTPPVAIASSAIERKMSHFDLKIWVTGETKIQPGIPSNWGIFEANWLDIAWEAIWIDHQYRVNLTQIF